MRKRTTGRQRRGIVQAQRRRQLLLAVGALILGAAAVGLVGRKIFVLRRQRQEGQQIDDDDADSSKGWDSQDSESGISSAGGKPEAGAHGKGEEKGKNEVVKEKEGRQELWPRPLRSGWLPYSSPVDPSHWKGAKEESNKYVLVRCNGGLNQQRSAIVNAVVVARILNAMLVVPRLDTNDFWNDSSSFTSVYELDHFIAALAKDVTVVKSLPPDIKPKKMKPPREASPSWYVEEAQPVLEQKGAVFFSPFAHRLAEELGDSNWGRELQRLRCRVNYHALRFSRKVVKVADSIVSRLHEKGPFIAIHMRFEKDMLSFAGCFDIFPENEQRDLQAYRDENFAEKELVAPKRRLVGKCPLTPHEMGLIIRAMGFPNSTQMYLAAGHLYAEERFLPELQKMYPLLYNRTSTASPEELHLVSSQMLLVQAVDFLVCSKADLFIPNYDGPSNFANNVIGERIYNGFKATVRPDRKALAQLVQEHAKGNLDDKAFELQISQMVYKVPLTAPYPRTAHSFQKVAFLADPWPECFCKDQAYKEDEFSQHPDHGGFEPLCPAGYNGSLLDTAQ